MAKKGTQTNMQKIIDAQRAKMGEKRTAESGERHIADLAERYPTVHAMMTYTGSATEPEDPCSLILFTDEHGLRGKLNDRERDCACWERADTLADLLEALETALSGPSNCWTSNKSGTVKTRKRGR